MSELNRRSFLRTGLTAGSALAMGCRSDSGAADGKAEAGEGRVAVAASEKVFEGKRALKADVARELVDAAVGRLLGEKNPTDAWKRLVKAKDTVGIKVNCLAGTRLSTQIEVVRAIAHGVRRAGVPAKRIVVFDRKRNDLVRARYPVDDRDEFVCIGNDHPTYGFSRREPLIMQGVVGSLFSRLVTRYCSAIINVPVLKDHDLSGVSLALKSFFGVIHNPNKYHLRGLHQAIADVNRVEAVRRKTILHLCDATFGCCHTGPTPSPRWLERLGAVYAARDPVALDYTLWQKIEELRKIKSLPSLVGSKREPQHIALAAKAELGTNDPKRIQLLSVEV